MFNFDELLKALGNPTTGAVDLGWECGICKSSNMESDLLCGFCDSPRADIDQNYEIDHVELEQASKYFGCSDGSDINDVVYREHFQKSLIAWYKRAPLVQLVRGYPLPNVHCGGSHPPYQTRLVCWKFVK